MVKEKSPSDKLEEINTVSKVIEWFFDESGHSERLGKQMKPFVEWLFDKALEAASEMAEEENNEL